MPTTVCLMTGTFQAEVGWVPRSNTLHRVAVWKGKLGESSLQAHGLSLGFYGEWGFRVTLVGLLEYKR